MIEEWFCCIVVYNDKSGFFPLFIFHFIFGSRKGLRPKLKTLETQVWVATHSLKTSALGTAFVSDVWFSTGFHVSLLCVSYTVCPVCMIFLLSVHDMWPTPTKPGTSTILHRFELLVLLEGPDFQLLFDTKIISLSTIYLEIWPSICDPNHSIFFRSTLWENDSQSLHFTLTCKIETNHENAWFKA